MNTVFMYLQEIEVTQRRIECETLNTGIKDAQAKCAELVSATSLLFMFISSTTEISVIS